MKLLQSAFGKSNYFLAFAVLVYAYNSLRKSYFLIMWSRIMQQQHNRLKPKTKGCKISNFR